MDDLKQFGVPVVLFSGGEPLMRPDLFDLVSHTVALGMRAVISTNGTLISQEIALRLKDLGLSYVGISLDGVEATHDRFRGKQGAFAAAMAGVRRCQEVGFKVGLRFTLNQANFREVPAIFDLVEEYDIPRICFYHLVYTGRGSAMLDQALSHGETRATVDLICRRTRGLFDRGKPVEVLTVDNHADGPYIYLKLLKEDPARAAEVLELLKMNEGNSSGRGIGCISWDGAVHADQFWRHHTLRECQGAAVQRHLDGPGRSPHGQAQGQKTARYRPLRRLPLAHGVRRQFPGPGRGRHRRPVGPGPGLLSHGRGNQLRLA